MTAVRNRAVGAPVTRIEGIAKVTGQARYAAEYPIGEVAYGWVVQSTVSAGNVVATNADAIRGLPGVIDVLTHQNALPLGETSDGELEVLQSPEVKYRGQVVALVVAHSVEHARSAADAFRARYESEQTDTDFRAGHPGFFKPEKVNAGYETDTEDGDVEAGLARADVSIDVTYRTPTEHNNPMEPHAATAVWDGDAVTVYDSTQGSWGVKQALSSLFGTDQVRVLAEHVGGGFGSKGTPRVHVVLAVMAAKMLDRPVKVVLTRSQMFQLTGYRTPTIQRMQLGATRDGRLTALAHDTWQQSSKVIEFTEQTATCSRMMYDSPAIRTTHRVVQLNVPSPRWMRAPGETPGMYALESAMDELAVALEIDPVELRIRNEPSRDPETGNEWTSRNLVRCLQEGASLFSWAPRDPQPGVRRDGDWLLGTGVAASVYPARSAACTATARRLGDERYAVEVNATDIGTGARTAMAQLAADALEVPLSQVDIRIADSEYGQANVAGGSMGTSSWGWAVTKACRELRSSGRDEVHVDTADDVKALPAGARYGFGAQFASVRVNAVTGEVRVPRMVGVFAVGRIVNAKTARSQFIGGMTMGIGMALMEESVFDPAFGDWVNHDLAGYHVPTNADIGSLEVSWLEEQDDLVNPNGIKGIGEIGIVGAAAAIGNAVWHATGARIRQLPLTPDRVLTALL